jgi:hypothetical protein
VYGSLWAWSLLDAKADGEGDGARDGEAAARLGDSTQGAVRGPAVDAPPRSPQRALPAQSLCLHVLGADRELQQPWVEWLRCLPSLALLHVCFVGPEVPALRSCEQVFVSDPNHPDPFFLEPAGVNSDAKISVGVNSYHGVVNHDTATVNSGLFNSSAVNPPHPPQPSLISAPKAARRMCVLRYSFHRGLYHEWQALLPPPDLRLALNPGMHFYAEWRETLARLRLGAAFPAPATSCSNTAQQRKAERAPAPLVVTAWSLHEALVTRQLLMDAGARIRRELCESPFASAVPQLGVDDHSSCCFANRFLIAVD